GVMFNQDPTGLSHPSDMPQGTADIITHTAWQVINEPKPVYGVWNLNADGDWNAAGSWVGSVPSGAGVNAYLTSKITANRIVTLNANQTVGTIQFDNAKSYTIAGSGSLAMNSPQQVVISSLNGNHAILVPVT